MRRGPLLLDTCAILWVMDDSWLSDAAVAALDEAADRRERVFISPITAWEIGNLARKGRFRSSYAPQRWLAVLLARPGIALAEMPPHLLMDSALLPGDLNLDPADRIMVATAREYGLTLLTRDANILAYAETGQLSAVAC